MYGHKLDKYFITQSGGRGCWWGGARTTQSGAGSQFPVAGAAHSPTGQRPLSAAPPLFVLVLHTPLTSGCGDMCAHRQIPSVLLQNVFFHKF